MLKDIETSFHDVQNGWNKGFDIEQVSILNTELCFGGDDFPATLTSMCIEFNDIVFGFKSGYKIPKHASTIDLVDVNVDHSCKHDHFFASFTLTYIFVDHFFCFTFHFEVLALFGKQTFFGKQKRLQDVFGDQNVLLIPNGFVFVKFEFHKPVGGPQQFQRILVLLVRRRD